MRSARAVSHASSGLESAIRPAVAPAESRNDRSNSTSGSVTAIATSDSPNARVAAVRRPRARARSTAVAIHAARTVAPVEGELVAAIGENRKMVIFPIDQVPDMTRGRGVRLQRHKDGGLSDIKSFEVEKGLSWTDSASRVFNLSLKELSDWRGNRADAGRLAPKGFPKNNKFDNTD